MKKVFLFLLASTALLTSCGSDDSGGSKRPSNVTLVGGGESIVYNMTYDTKGRLNTLTSTFQGAHTYTFVYNEKGKISNISASGSTTIGMTLAYNSDGKLSTITRTGEEPVAITWISDTSFTYGDTTILTDAKGNLVQFDIVSFTRDTGKGAFASVKGSDEFILAALESQTLFFASKKPAKTISGGGSAYIMDNDFEGGYVSGATFNANGTQFTMSITY